MKKNYFLKSIMIMLFSMLLSCDNTTADPINQNNVNPANGSSGSTGSTGTNGSVITGPRILHKIMVGNSINEEYVTTGSILNKAIFKEESGPNSYYNFTVTYTSGKITKINSVHEVNGVPAAISIASEYILSYNSAGKINNVISTEVVGSVTQIREFVYTYNSIGQIFKTEEKRRSGNTYMFFTNYTYTYTGNNITNVQMLAGNTTASGTPITTGNVITGNYIFTYDNKINPYTTLPDNFIMVFGLNNPVYFVRTSANNISSYNYTMTGQPQTSGTYNYTYDSQNYPNLNQNLSANYIYKAL